MNKKSAMPIEKRECLDNLGLGESLILIWLVLVAIFFAIAFGSATVSFQFTRNFDVIFTKWYSGIVFFVLPPVVLLLCSNSRYILPGVIFYLWLLAVIIFLTLVISPGTTSDFGGHRIRIDIYQSWYSFGENIFKEIFNLIILSVIIGATVYLLKSERYK